MKELIEIIGLACLTNILVEAEPIKRLKSWIGIKDDAQNPVVSFLARLLSCSLCLGTWVGMIGMWSFEKGAIVAIVAELISRKINSVEL